MQWDLFCRVVDNFGDIGVCWRLAADLGGRGESVRLFVDDASALAWLAPAGAANVSVHSWDSANDAEPGDVVVEAFGCDPHQAFVARMAARPTAPAWINLEYLSAEGYVERSHGLSSPVMAGPGRGLVKWFYYPGFTARTGGLIREPWMAAEQASFDPRAWLAVHGVAREVGERLVSLFCYDDAPVAGLIERLSLQPTLLLATPGAATMLARAALGDSLRAGRLRCIPLPFLDQRDFDRLLWSCDLNLVRGEDSFVRAQWAAKPFVWQAYRQDDDLHLTKVDAFLALYLAGAPAEFGRSLRTLWHEWNAGALSGESDATLASITHAELDVEWMRHAANWKFALAALPTESPTQSPDLTHGLMHFAARLVRFSR